ncbi:MAG: glycosyltransferase [Clostridium perfringens]|nr:glycosyltransferase [Clostridium perfringens]
MIIDIVLIYGTGHGGVENAITQVAKGLKNKGHKVRVFQSHKPYYEEWINTLDEIYYYGNPNKFYDINDFYDYAISYKNLLFKLGKPNIVLATHSTLSSYLCHLALKENINTIPIISWIHGPSWVYGWECLLNYCNGHLAISSLVSKSIQSKINSKNIFLIGNPIEVEEVKIVPRTLTSIKILYLSRLDKEKGTDLLLKALANVKGNWELIVLGDGSLSLSLKKLAYTLGISNKISWLGWQEDPWSKVYDASLTVISSPSEGFSLSTAESLARGIPVVSSRCGGPEDMIQDGINGWLYDVNNINMLSKILNNIVNKTYKLPSQEVCIRSIQKYSKNNVINNIEKILKNYTEKA